MRFIIHVNADWKVAVTCPTQPAVKWERSLRKQPDGRAGNFPLPPESELPASTEAHFGLCAGDANLFWRDYQDISARDLKADTTRRFGSYLFETLIGTKIWNDILRVAGQAGEQFIELNLSWSKTASELHRLNWEMMHGPNGFLFREHPRTVAITRGVPDTAHTEPRPASLPPRVLFVIGTSLYDTQIRAGAEYLGLLRQLQRNERSILSKTLQRASPQLLIQAMKTFEPDVVHFICHGGFNANEGHGYLELEMDESDSQRERYATQLWEFLNAAGKPPSIVVLSACQTANISGPMLGANELAPLAAELVACGIPVVVGMGGQISDQACRLFTRRFGEALVLGEPLVRATGEGRRAAFSEGASPYSSADWALPAVFLAEGVQPSYAPVSVEDPDKGDKVESWISRYKLASKPVFCSRDDFFDEYEGLFRSKGCSVLVVYVKNTLSGYGRTRLLQQMARTALRDGHVPCFVGSDAADWPAPQNIAQLCVEILRAIGTARAALSLSPPVNGMMLKVLKSKKPSPGLQQIESDFRDDPKIYFGQLLNYFSCFEDLITVDNIKEALQHDLSCLVADARRKYPSMLKPSARPLLLLDEVHRYDKALYPLFHELLPLYFEISDDSGSDTKNDSVPAILSLSFGSPADVPLISLKETAAAKSWIKFKELKEFDAGEDMLAYEQVLLHPFANELWKGVSDKPWAFNYDAGAEIVKRWEERLRKRLDQIPSDFSRDVMFALVENAIEAGFVVAADDETLLAKERARQ